MKIKMRVYVGVRKNFRSIIEATVIEYVFINDFGSSAA